MAMRIEVPGEPIQNLPPQLKCDTSDEEVNLLGFVSVQDVAAEVYIPCESSASVVVPIGVDDLIWLQLWKACAHVHRKGVCYPCCT